MDIYRWKDVTDLDQDELDLAIIQIIKSETIEEESEDADGVAGPSGIETVPRTVDHMGIIDQAGAWGFAPLDIGRLRQEQKDDENQMIQLIDLLQSICFDPSKFIKKFQ